ncbi:MAG: LptF/LptG family permease [Rikenellaceae bacterium]|nr:LptF/LptG family permease [Rikenellaceae bacterium]
MKTIDKFTLRSFLGPLLASFFIVMFVLMMNALWRYIDELVGKGLGLGTIAELIFYATANLVPLGLPLVALFAAILTMSNMGESYELLAMKSAGMSLQRILAPLAIVALLFSIGSFFVANNYVPFANQQMVSILYDIRQQKQELEFKDGAFFNGIDDMSIRVEHQDPETKLLYDVIIYDNRDKKGKMSVTLADSGYIRLSEDKKFLLITLYHGETYEEDRGKEWKKATTRNHKFVRQDGTMPTAGFAIEKSDRNMFSGSHTKNIEELDTDIDSLEHTVNTITAKSYEPLLKNYVFTLDPLRFIAPDSSAREGEYRAIIDLGDSIGNRSIDNQMRIFNDAYRNAMSSSNVVTYDEFSSKEALNQLYRSRIEWHRKLALPVSVMIFFLIGAPLGAIIRKGGLGMSVLVSVIFFVIYYVIILFGEKMARDGILPAYIGMWISTFILFPIAIYLTYKAATDSNLMSSDWYYNQWIKVREWWETHIASKKKVKTSK